MFMLSLKNKMICSRFFCTVLIGIIFLCSFVFDLSYNTILFFYISCYLVFFIFGKNSSKYFFASLYFVFISFFILYTNTFPFLFFAGDLNFFDVQQKSLMYAYLYGFRFFLCMLIPFFLMPDWFIINFTSAKNIKFRKYIDSLPNISLEICSMFLLCGHIIVFIFFGGLAYYLSGSTSRGDINVFLENTYISSLLNYLNILLFVILLIKRKLNIHIKVILLLPIIFNLITNLFMGGRKQILLFIIILFLLHTINLVKIKKKNIVLIFFIMLFAIYYRSIYMDKGWGGTIYQNIAGITGEFIFPQITFPLSLQLNFTSSEFNYPTLFDGFIYFIPRDIFPLKNNSINVTFSNMMDVGMGFATTPLLEAYINFGECGYIFEALLLCALLKLLTLVLNKNKNYLFFIFAYIYLIDLNRGEISIYMRQIFEMTMIMSLCFLFLNKNTTKYILKCNKKRKMI